MIDQQKKRICVKLPDYRSDAAAAKKGPAAARRHTEGHKMAE